MDAFLRHLGFRLLAAPIAVLTLGVFADPGYAQVNCCQDPVVTHTNGMRLASTTPERSHNVYWQCDPLRIGYCNGRMHGPVRHDLRRLGTRKHGYFLTPTAATPGPVGAMTHNTLEGLETEDSESLGTLRMVGGAGGALAAAAPARGTPALGGDGETWLESLQRLGEAQRGAGEALP